MKLFILLLSVSLLAACASSKSGDVYTRDQARHEMTVRKGVIESVREVRMEGTKTPVGGGAGAIIGGVAGSAVGSGRGSIIGSVVGAVAGGLAGSAVEEGVTRKPALEITVELDGGRSVVIVQEGSLDEFRVGDHVRVVSSYGDSRVTH